MNTQTLDRPLERATVTVQYVNPAKSKGRSGSIKDIDGQYFGVRPEMLADFAPGQAYEVEFSSTVKDGVMYRDIKRSWPVEQEQPQAQRQPQRAATAQASRAPAQRSAPITEPRPEPQPQRPASNGNGGQYFRPTSPKDARRMFLCSQLNAMITSHQVAMNAQGIADAIAMLADAYDATIGQEDQS